MDSIGNYTSTSSSLVSDIPRYDVGRESAQFTYNSYKALAANAGNDNIIASPFSITLALMLAYAGTEGRSKEQIESSLGIQGYSRKEVLQGYSHTLKQLSKEKENGAPYKLNIANNAFIEQTYQLKQQYIEDIKKYLGVTPSNENFKGDKEGVRNKINQWAANNTENKIKEPLSEEAITPETVFVLVNAIYFKSVWKIPFSTDQTVPRTFKNLDGSQKNADMMFQTNSFDYYHNEEGKYQIIAIQYKENKNALFVVLPDEGQDYKAFEQKITTDFISQAAQNMRRVHVRLGLPKFKFTQEYDLQQTLSNLGMDSLFTGEADFSSLSPTPSQLSKAIHKAFVDVNEEGTEAAAFTGFVGIAKSSMVQRRPKEMICDRPFFFLIRNDAQNLPLFTGRVSKL